MAEEEDIRHCFRLRRSIPQHREIADWIRANVPKDTRGYRLQPVLEAILLNHIRSGAGTPVIGVDVPLSPPEDPPADPGQSDQPPSEPVSPEGEGATEEANTRPDPPPDSGHPSEEGESDDRMSRLARNLLDHE